MKSKRLAAALLTAVLTLGMSVAAFAQTTVKGTVLDKNGEPVIGAAVLVLEDATKGTVVDDLGNYTISVKKGNTLQFTSIGYKTKEVKVGSQSVIDVVLEDDVNLLDDVVVIGYGSARKGDMTGSISSVKGENLNEGSSQMLSNALQGQIAGLQVTRSDGGPGSGSSIRIHGVTTMSTNDPLVIVDGVPGDIDDVVAEDVETLTVLKDAAAAAIYGSRAAAGVILITTKRAKVNAFNVSYNMQFAVDTPTARPTNGDVIDWFNLQNEIKWNDGAGSDHSVYSEELIDGWMANNAKDPIHYPNTNWQDIILKKTTTHQQHTFTVSGGTEKMRTKFTMNYQQGNGYYDNKSYERFAGRLNNDWQIAKWLNVKADVDFSKSNSVNPACGTWAVMHYAYITAPYYNQFWADGRDADVKDGANIYASIRDGGTSNSNYYKFGGKLQLDITPVKNLTFSFIFAPRFNFHYNKNFSKAVDVYKENGSVLKTQWHKTTNLSETRNLGHNYTYQAYANYANKWGDHSFSAMAGYEGFTNFYESLGASRNNYTLTNYPYLNLGPEDFQYNSGSASHNAYQSVFGRLMYSYKGRYMIQANVRADASSRFAKECRWGVFPSVSAGWVISDEPWFNNDKVVNYLKLRGSYGQLGNERIGSDFPYQATMTFGNSYMYDKSSASVTAVQNAAQVYYAFRDITWETTTSMGLGVDAAFFDSRLRATLDLYHKKTENMLLTLGFPAYAGFSAPSQNAGDMFTNGWDFEIGWADKVGDFRYSISANVSDYRSKMGYLGDKKTINGNYLTEKGSYFNEWYMYESAGLIQTEADMFNADGTPIATLTKNDQPGCIKYVDQNNDGVINEEDKVKLGNSMPEYLYGGNISLGYKNWDFGLTFQGVGHQQVLFNTAWIQPLSEQWGAMPSLLLGNYWSKHNTAEQNLNAKYPMITYTNTTNTYAGSSYWLFNGAYFRVKNITLGYTLPKTVLDKTFVRGARAFLSVADLPAISNYPKGWDPELGRGGGEISTSFIVGINLKF